MTTDGTDEETRREVRELATRGTDIGDRLAGLDAAVRAARGRLDDGLLDRVQATVDRATGRLRLSATHTVVGIAGATGSGKSSTYNSLVGLELSSVGVRRPTTSWATACVWGSEGAAELLEWLGIPPRHQTMRDSMLDARHHESGLDGVVLLDLPDHDSTELSHHLEVDRLVDLADLLVWVLDPQKYADAALHDRYLAPYHTHGDVILVVLNQIDTIPEGERQSMIDDVRRLLVADGLPQVKVIAFSAQEGIGMAELRGEIESRVDAKRHASGRVETDIAAAAAQLDDDGRPRALAHEDVADLVDRIGTAAGVESVAATVGRRTRARAARATGWPLVAPFRELRSDPQRQLPVDLGEDAKVLGGRGVEPAPRVSPVSREMVGESVRSLTDHATQRLSGPWAEAIDRAGARTVPEATVKLGDRLSQVDLRNNRLPGWVRAVQVLQWLLLLAAVAGGAWWLAGTVSNGVPAAPAVGPVSLPVLLLVAGLVGGVALALASAAGLSRLARQRAAETEDRLRGVIEEVVQGSIARPVDQELADYASFKVGLAQAIE
ncbi:hypothetical protein KUV85_01185 [Nocardioides panacisoli]|uniref:hypothetical protein n=1 Tax=Nocardioides panacisoli TaxID=627624 RepID=UPI001C63777E|nr:hypothetical protein [Nocardioides panacisoli]QYJ04321.1 hypothetical protein KUV85_01185 [Nocardioides panacisoli]